MFLAGAKNLEANKEYINELNVFPVPDGDTGTNMTMTIMSAAKEVAGIESPDMKTLSKAISSGSLRGARGNSGVILSQLFRGFTKVIKEETGITPAILASSFQKAVETAYKAVMKPKEGTILTVAKGAADEAERVVAENPDITLEDMLPLIVAQADKVLQETPELLPVLKEAGVVDSGGMGLLKVLEGAYDAFCGKEIHYSSIMEPAEAEKKPAAKEENAEQEIKFGYCTEFIILPEKPFTKKNEAEFKEFLTSIGDSIVIVADEDLVKVHVHTNEPGVAITRALTYGQLTKMKIDNMREEHHERVIQNAEKLAQEQIDSAEPVLPAEPEKEVGFIAVSIGDGLSQIFKDLGVDYIIEGGQTMNPSTEDMLNAIEKVNARNIFIFPNNKNIILAANQAKSLVENRNILVVETKTIPQGITAMINYVPDKSPEENAEAMVEEIAHVKTGQLTYAVRDTHIDDKTIKAGDIMGVGDHAILAVGKDVDPVALETLDQMVDEDSELISIYYGEDMREDEAEHLLKQIQERFPDLDAELNFGGQPIYYYMLSVE